MNHCLLNAQLLDDISASTYTKEAEALEPLQKEQLTTEQMELVSRKAAHFIAQMRRSNYGNVIEAFLQEYTLDSREGILLMMLAEALLRIPDNETATLFIQDKVTQGSWLKHLRWRNITLVNAASLGLALASFCLRIPLVKNIFKPLLRVLTQKAVHFLGYQFVMSATLPSALERSHNHQKTGHMYYSYDMLGEAARTQEEAERYFEAYRQAIVQVGRKMEQIFGPLAADAPAELIMKRSGISIKLSALHPRYEASQMETLRRELIPRLLVLLELGRHHNINITLDAEESYRLDIMLEIFETTKKHPSLAGWNGYGLVLQAYLKTSSQVLEYITKLASDTNTVIPMRLVKGAYWDSEIKHAQELGLKDYPVFTRKSHTDACYLALARRMLASRTSIFPQFATHNAYTISYLLELTKDVPSHAFELQKLYGMGDDIYGVLKRTRQNKKIFVRTYAPIGSYRDLLPYLVRRFLENGASTSFLPLVYKKTVPIERLTTSPFAAAEKYIRNKNSGSEVSFSPSQLALPRHIYKNRLNSRGVELSNKHELSELQAGIEKSFQTLVWEGYSIIDGQAHKEGAAMETHCPWDKKRKLGSVWNGNEECVSRAFEQAQKAFPVWEGRAVAERAHILRKAADLYEEHMSNFIAIAVAEGGKTLNDCVAEVREAVDFLRYYADQAEGLLKPTLMPGPTGEKNELLLNGRGVFVCISPWNFPLAIFTGQIAAALVSGNTVLAKPAEQTPIMATYAVKLLHEAGVPSGVLHLLIGEGHTIGAALTQHPLTAGVVFTGSVDTAHIIHQTLAKKRGAIVPFIAETGGQNAMIVDSSALPEQVTVDILSSAFQSAGQRCSALRVLFVQEDIAGRLIPMLTQALADLKVGDPSDVATDVGPLIDEEALQKIKNHKDEMESKGKLLASAPLAPSVEASGYFVAPSIFSIDHLNELKEEIFGPCLHILTYKAEGLDSVIEQINSTGYGLTMGIHSRIESCIEHIARRVRCGNIYVNRNIIGAVVGTQPFGGCGLSGTGPKAGGPHYLMRFLTERVVTTNLTAIGGNTQLLMTAQDH